MAKQMEYGQQASYDDISREEDFGLIRPNLIKQLRSILDQYPDDSQILKEVLQNAEDAKATTVSFLYDENEHECDPNLLYHPDLAKYQGPALYAYNNAMFEEKDWTGIRMLQDSVKEKDPMKVGRFGLGFKSVLHMTDLPSVLSSDRLAIIDPHEKYFKYKGQNTTGYSWHLQQRKQDLAQIPDQIQPFLNHFGCTEDVFEHGFFNGTIFHFPLRRKPSELSELLYSTGKMMELFHSFEADAHLVLLFLKSVEQVQLYVQPVGQASPDLQFVVQIAADCADQVRSMRKQFLQSIDIDRWMSQPATVTYPIFIETLKYEKCQKPIRTVYRWLVSEYYAGGDASLHLKMLHKDPILSHIPLVGVAMPLDTHDESSEVEENGENSEESSEKQPRGHIFCFLPLPVEQKSSTGLPVHVNGYFAISQNRRHLKWPTSSQNVKGDKSLLWNQLLLGEVLPKAYIQLVLQAIQLSKANATLVHPQDIFQALPDLVNVDEKWQVLLPSLYGEILHHKIFFTACHGGKWISVVDCIFDCMKEAEDIKSIVKSVLLQGGINVVEIPRHVLHAMGAFSTISPEIISPSLLRSILRSQPPLCANLAREVKLQLLTYILKDEDFPDLDGVQLLPLLDGSFGTFQCGRNKEQRVYIASEQHPAAVLLGQENSLLDENLPENMKRKLNKLATSGETQLENLRKEVVLGRIPALVPKDWYQMEMVTLKAEEDKKYINWLEALWEYLRLHMPDDLAMLSGLPILALPTAGKDGEIQVLPLAMPSTVIISRAMGTELSESVWKSLEVLGARIVSDMLVCVRNHAAVMGNYVRLPLPEDILYTVVAITKNKTEEAIQDFTARTSDTDKRELRSVLSKVNPKVISHSQKKFLRMLPVFDIVKGDINQVVEMVSVEQVDKGAPSVMPCISINEKLLDLTEHDARVLAEILDVKMVTTSELLTQIIFVELISDDVNPEKMEATMQYVIENLPQLMREDPEFVDHLITLPFIPKADGKYVKPCEVFDPESEFLLKFFYSEDVFPTGKYTESHQLMFLRQLGLQGESAITAITVVKSVVKVEALADSTDCDVAKREEKAKAILQFLNDNPDHLETMLRGRSLAQWLANVPWLPILKERPTLYPDTLHWFQNPTLFAKPKDVKMLNWFPLIGAVAPLTQENVCKELSEAFGWNGPPPLDLVLEQLKKVTEVYQPKYKAKFLAVITGIYDYLFNCNRVDLVEALTDKSLTEWVWFGEGFTSLEKIIMQKLPLELQPYMFALPSEIQLYKSLFEECGAKSCCDNHVLIKVLSAIAAKYSSAEVLDDSVARDRQLAIDILNLLKKDVSDMAAELRNKILVPVQVADEGALRMLPVVECTYCDTEWLRKGFHLLEFDEHDGIVFIHDMLPVSTAEGLGVPTLMSRMLHAEELTVTGFGQAEPLTTRLHRILQDYTDGFSVPKELIQNADDAGATEFKLLYDERTNEDCNKYLIDEGMKDCHGPALWAYNNAVFTDIDFANITKLGGATKEKEMDKIGKFGLGFNAVYNLTDVPSFISRNYLVIFDPHTTHVGRGIKDRTKPGIKIDMKKNRTLIRKLPDQFKPYQNMFGCVINGNGENHFEGTLFRLPLRTKQQAKESEISNFHYDDKEVIELLKIFIGAAGNLLLFTQNVKVVEIYHLTAGEADPRNAKKIFEVHKEHLHTLRCIPDLQILPPHAKTEDSNFNILKAGAKYLDYARAARNTKVNPKANPLGATLILKICTDMPTGSSMLQKSEMTKTETEADTTLVNTPKGDPLEGLVEIVGAETRAVEQYWMVSYVLGEERSLTLSLDLDEGFVPVGSVAVPLAQDGGSLVPVSLTEIGSKGLVFCYLPLPIYTGLPLHINGSFAVQSNRRYLCELTEDDKYNSKADWNDALLEDAVCKAYIQLLCDSKSLNGDNKSVCYYELWPCVADVMSNMMPLVTRFYQECVKHNKFPVVSDQGKLVTLSNAVFLDPLLAEHETIGLLAIQAFTQCQTNNCVVHLPARILQSFSSTGLDDYIAEKTYMQDRFFSEIFFPNIQDFQPETRNALVLHAINQNQFDLDQLLRSVPCIPVQTDGRELQCPQKLIHPSLNIAKMFGPEDGVFPHGSDFLNTNCLNQLLRLGMKGSDLDWDGVIERAESIRILNMVDVTRSKQRLQVLLHFIDRKLVQEKKQLEGDHLEAENASNALRSICFLPVLAKPPNFPLPWKGDELAPDMLQSAEELRLKEHMYVLSSTQLIINDTEMSQTVKNFLGLSLKPVEVEHVLVQIEHALRVNPKELSKESYEELNNVVNAIYMQLEKRCKDDPELSQFLCEELSQRNCILLDREFLSSSCVAFNCAVDVSPYLYALPIEMSKKYKQLMKSLGVREKFEVNDYIKTLEKLRQEHGDNALKERKLEQALSLVLMLNSSMKLAKLEIKDVLENYGVVYIPNAQGILQPSTELCYNDCPWIQATQSMNFTHPDITYQASTKLGVKTKRQEALTKYASGIPFGQKERLTNSLRRVLGTYPCNQEIFKELIQNADDAQASEIHFITDPRQHPEEHVFENSWRPLQGPALCVYNNKPFKLTDLEAIQQLGEGSKVHDPNKTGQYGIGFSSVYHITDAPSLLTSGKELGETLCIFDPHCHYVPGATPSEPGMRFSNLSDLRTTFPDVFHCYLEDILHLDDATVFRFPLRNPHMAQKSDISKLPFNIQYIQKLLNTLASEAFEILLFTNHLTSLSISQVDLVTGQLVNTYTVHVQLTEEDQKLRHHFYEVIQEKGRQLRDGEISISEIPVEEVSYKMTITDSLGVTKRWCVTQRLGFAADTEVPESVQRAFSAGDLALLPRGGTACLLEKRDQGQIQEEKLPSKVFCFLPLPVETDLPVHINGHFSLGHENRRHLWTNTDSEGYQRDWNDLLCKQVIAPCYVKLLHSIRVLGLKASFDADSDVVHVQCSRQILDSALKTYQHYFPNYSESKPQWDNLVTAIYQSINHLDVPLFPAVREVFNPQNNGQPDLATSSWAISWLPACGTGSKKAFFTRMEKKEATDEQSSFFGKFKSFFKANTTMNEKSDSQILKEVLIDCGFKILEANAMLAENFERAGIMIDFMSPEGVILFFQSNATENPMCEIGPEPLPVALSQTPFRDEKMLKIVLKYCRNSSTFLTELSGMPLLLTCDGILRVFDRNNPVFVTDHYDLVPACAGLFLHESLKDEIFKNVSLAKCDVFKPFSITAFSQILPQKLSEDIFCQTKVPVVWKKSMLDVPNEMWLRKAWNFIRSEVKDLLKMKDLGKDEIQSRLTEIKSRLEPLASWCLVPTSTRHTNKLFPVGRAEEVTDLRTIESTTFNYYVRDILRKLNLPELDSSVLNAGSTSNGDFVHLLVTTLDKPALVLRALHKAFSNSEAAVLLSKLECSRMLQYFSDGIEQVKDCDDSVSLLLDLPFYMTIHGDIIKLTGCLVYVLPEKIPTDDIDVWQSKSGTVFLERNSHLQSLYDHLGCATLGVLDVYCSFILQHFEYFSPQARMVHLRHIYTEYLTDRHPSENLNNEERKNLLDALSNLTFIEDKDGELHPASDFYDPETVLFRVMLPEEKLPPRAGTLFRESEWLSFLRKLGLMSEVSKDSYIEFAHQVAQEGRDTTSASALTKSKVMTQHLFSMESAERDKVLVDVSDIPFLVPERVSPELSSMYPQYGDIGDGKLEYVSFQKSYSKDYENLVWSEAPLLPKWADPMKQDDIHLQERVEIVECLGMAKRPPSHLVVRHLKTLCQHLNEVPSNSCDVHLKRQVFRHIYQYLQEHAMEDDDITSTLEELPCIFVKGTMQLAQPCYTCINMLDSDEIPPYLFKVPTELGEFHRLFSHIGTTEVPTFDQYASVLERMYRDLGSEMLLPNELTIAFKAVKGLFTTLDECSVNDIKSKIMYLPSESGKLTETTKLVFNDMPSYYDRVREFGMQFLFDLKECGIRYRNFEDMVEKLPKHLQPGMLSAFVKETLVNKCKNSLKTSGMAAELNMRLTSEQFMQAVARLVRHENHKRGKKQDEYLMYGVLDRLSTIKVYSADLLITHLLYRGKPIGGSELEKACFVEKVSSSSVPEIWNVFIQNKSDLNQDLLIPLAEVVNTILSGMLRDSVLFLLPILTCPELQIQSKLDHLNVRLDHTQSTSKMSTIPPPGTAVPRKFLKWVAPQAGGLFSTGEYAAYRVNKDDDPVYAKVTASLYDDDFTNSLPSNYLVEITKDEKAVVMPPEKLHKITRSDF